MRRAWSKLSAPFTSEPTLGRRRAHYKALMPPELDLFILEKIR